MSAVDWTAKPELQLTIDDPRAWGAVEPGKHALHRSVMPGQGGRDEPVTRDVPTRLRTAADCEFVGTEPVPGVGCVMVTPVLPRPVPDMVKAAWDLDHAAYWHTIKTEITRQRWLKFARSWADAAPEAGVSQSEWYFEPGVLLRARCYGINRSQSKPSFFGFGAYDLDGDAWRWQVILPRQASEAPGGSPLPWEEACRTGSPFVVLGSVTGVAEPYAVYHGSWSVTPGQDIMLRVRVVGRHLILQGPGLAEPWVTVLPADLYGEADPVDRFGVLISGGMALFHAGQLEYRSTGTVRERAAFTAPPHVTTDDQAGAVHAIVKPGSGVASSLGGGTLAAALTASPHRSPQVFTLTERRQPTQLTPTTDPTVTYQVQRAEVKLTYVGRGQTCHIELVDVDASLRALLQADSVCTLKARWSGEGTWVTLFAGRVAQPLTVRTSTDGSRANVEIDLVDDECLLRRKPCLMMTGSWAGVEYRDAVVSLLAAGGIPETRITCVDDATVLKPLDPGTLRFGPEENVLRALDTLTLARGWEWYIGPDGGFTFAEPPTYSGTPDLTIDDDENDPLQMVSNLVIEEQLTDDYHNHTAVLSEVERVSALALQTPAGVVTDDTDPDFMGHDLWHVAVGEYASPEVECRREQSEGLKRVTLVSFDRGILDVQSLLLPRGFADIGDVAEQKLANGTVLRVRNVTIVAEAGGLISGHYEATVESTP